MNKTNDLELEIARLVSDIGQSVEIYYEPRNEGAEWYVGLANYHDAELPIHDHFPSLILGLEWLVASLTT